MSTTNLFIVKTDIEKDRKYHSIRNKSVEYIITSHILSGLQYDPEYDNRYQMIKGRLETDKEYEHREYVAGMRYLAKYNEMNSDIWHSRYKAVPQVACDMLNEDTIDYLIAELFAVLPSAVELIESIVDYMTIPQLEYFKKGDIVRILISPKHRNYITKAVILSINQTEAVVQYYSDIYSRYVTDKILNSEIYSHLYTEGDTIYFILDNTHYYGRIMFRRLSGKYVVQVIDSASTVVEPIWRLYENEHGSEKHTIGDYVVIGLEHIKGFIIGEHDHVWFNSHMSIITNIKDRKNSTVNGYILTFKHYPSNVSPTNIIYQDEKNIEYIDDLGFIKTLDSFPVKMTTVHNWKRVGEVVLIIHADGEEAIICGYPINHKEREVRPLPIVGADPRSTIVFIWDSTSGQNIEAKSLINPITWEPLAKQDIFVGALVSIHHSNPVDKHLKSKVYCVMLLTADRITICDGKVIEYNGIMRPHGFVELDNQ
jgi:hypothetical protein